MKNFKKNSAIPRSRSWCGSDVFREAARLKLLNDAERWFEYLKKRNITVHAYRKEILDDLFANTAKEFLKDLDYLLVQLEKQAPDYASNKK